MTLYSTTVSMFASCPGPLLIGFWSSFILMWRFIVDINIVKSEVGSRPKEMGQPFKEFIEIFHAMILLFIIYFGFYYFLCGTFLINIFNTCLSFVEFNDFATV